MLSNIVIFANSVKNNWYCVAGKDIQSKKWVRPIADNEERDKEWALSYGRCICENTKKIVKPFDIVTIDITKHLPLLEQPENYVISQTQWKWVNTIEKEDINHFLDSPLDLRLCKESRYDRVPYSWVQEKKLHVTQSLYLIFIEKIHVYWKYRDEQGKNPQRRWKFSYRKIDYDFPITDPQFAKYEPHDLANKFLCVSLSASFHGFCYKIIASML